MCIELGLILALCALLQEGNSIRHESIICRHLKTESRL